MSLDSGSDSDAPPVVAKSQGSSIRTLIIQCVIVVATVAGLVLLCPPTRHRSREAARRSHCRFNLKQIGLALQNYHEAHGTFPPAYTVDASGRPLHSWRTLLLPFLDQEALYQQIDLSQPWDAPVNAAARETAVSVYSCPSTKLPRNYTIYLGSTGPEAFFDRDEPRRFDQITDPPEETLMVLEAGTNQALPWMSPLDLPATAALVDRTDADRAHAEVDMGLFADAQVRPFVKTTAAQRRPWITIAGGD